MATLTPYSSNYKREDKLRQTSLSFHTPAFSKENQPDNVVYEEKTSRKKVLFTPKPEGAVKDMPISCPKSTSTQAYTSCNSSTSSRTSCKETLNTHQANEVKKSLSSALDLTPSTTNKKVSKKEDEAETQKAQRYGKRKIQYTDSDEEDPEIKQDKLEVAEGRKSKQLKRMTLSEPPKHTMLYLYNSTKTQIYCFPVFQESDLKYKGAIQDLLKEADIDNDCATENEILDYSIFQAKKDLAKGIQMQREADQQAKKVPSFEERLSRSQESDKDKDSGEKVKDETINFWTKVSGSFRDLFGQDRRSL